MAMIGWAMYESRQMRLEKENKQPRKIKVKKVKKVTTSKRIKVRRKKSKDAMTEFSDLKEDKIPPEKPPVSENPKEK
jgi:hypothetical protein